MAGQPLKRRVLEALQARATSALGEEASALDYAVEWIASGKSVQALADSLAAELQTSVSRPLVSSILHSAASDATARLDAARREGAHALADEMTHIADTAEATAGGAAKARVQIGTRQWLAERFAPDRFGQKANAVQLNVSIGSLMLDALRQPIAELNIPAVPVLTPGEATPADYEIAE
jgi:hypothetical protein